MNERGHSERVHAPGQRHGSGAGGVHPPLDSHLTVPGIDPHRDSLAERLHQPGHKRLALGGACADDHPADPQPERPFDRVPRAEPAAQLHL